MLLKYKMRSPNRNPKKRATCVKRHMKWMPKTEDHKGFCRVKNNKVAKSKSRSRKGMAKKSKSRSPSRKGMAKKSKSRSRK
jgi:hypothetical protein